MSNELTCFKAYDIRGRIPDQLNDDIAYRIGAAFARQMKPSQVVVGHDIRLSSPQMASAVANGLLDSGVDVIDIGLCGTEEVYFATSHLQADGGIMVTASHNPADYNGMKLVREGSRPVSGDTGLNDIRRTAESFERQPAASRGRLSQWSVLEDYVAHLLGYVEAASLKPLKIVTNAGNGGAGHVIDRLETELPFEFIKVHHDPDGSFPHGVPNPLLPENRAATSEAVKRSGADFGLAWDGDFDRCFFFDANGDFIEGYYVVGLLARSVLSQNPGEKIIHDPRLTWNTRAIVESLGGVPVQSKTGHAFIKERMRSEDAAYGGEMSAHHYFRDFFYCDSGMIPWLLVAGILSESGETLSSLVAERMEAYPVSGEINRQLTDPAAAIRQVFRQYGPDAIALDETDGLSLEFTDWRFNLRMSNTEPVVRLNVETRGDRELMERRTKELLELLD